MALETVIDVAEIDDLGFRVVAEESPAHAGRQLTRSSRAFGIWGVALVAITSLGLVGRFLEAPSEQPGAVPSLPKPPALGTITSWPPNGHSGFRYPSTGVTTMTVRIGRIPGVDGSISWLAVSGRIDGPPVGTIVVELISGLTTYGALSQPYTRGDGRTTSRVGEFELALRVPAEATPTDLWVVARAFVDEQVVAVASVPVDPNWSADGPGRFVLDDVVGDTARHPAVTHTLVRPLRN